jgi:hypothetical protein
MLAAGLDFTLDEKTLGAQLLDAESSATACAGRRIIDSREPEASVLLSAVDHTRREASGACALTMPPGTTGDGLPPADIACLASWVKDLTAGKQPEPFEPVSMATALAKLKLLVHGGAVTDAELTGATADPNTVRDLVEGWTKTPEFAVKLRSFLGTALQQDSVGAMKETLGFPTAHFTPSEMLRAAVARSFLDTAMDIVQSGAPFTEVVTSHKRSITTAELLLLAYSDQTSNEIDATNYKVRFVGPDKKGNTPATLTKNGDVWELGGAAQPGQTCRVQPGKGAIPDPQIMPSPQFLAMLFGRVQCRGKGDLKYTGPVTPADHTDARAVSLETTQGKALDFTDVASLRAIKAGAAVRLHTPRPGFFSASVFLDNWPTNKDNAFRVTLNQTLMVALGSTFSMSDPTQNAMTGIDQEHAAPETPCFSCHRLMDPMRPFLSNGLDSFYRTSGSPAEMGTFAFFGSTTTGTSAEDLAQAIIHHPRFATAWVLKICSWANSRACSEAEPGVAELAQGFQSSGWDFHKLLVDTLSSPLVTGLSGTALSIQPEASITRRRHLCAELQVRLGAVVDSSGACNSAEDDLARSIPDDAFARNQPGFVQLSSPGMFYAAGVERMCEALAPAAVKSLFPSSDVPGSAKKLVESFMGLPPSHPRHDAAVTALAAHCADVIAAGGTKDQAVESAFVVACTSPDVTGAGL